MPGEIRTVQSVREQARERGLADPPTVILTARVALSTATDVRVAARPVVATLADAHEGPRVEIHTEDGTSVVLSGPPLLPLFEESIGFLRSPESGSAVEHDRAYGLRARFDLGLGPFAVVEQPPFDVASARTFVHPSGSVALRLLGIDRVARREPFHSPATAENEDVRPAFDLQLTARRAEWLAGLLQRAAQELGVLTSA